MKNIFLIILFIAVSINSFSQLALSKIQLAKIERIMAPLRSKVEDLMKKSDPKLYTEYVSQRKFIFENNDSKKKNELIKEFHQKYYNFVKLAYIKANIDEARIIKKFNKIIDLDNYKVSYGEFLSITGWYKYTPPAAPTNGDGCFELKCPMTVLSTTMGQGNVGNGKRFADECEASAVSTSYIFGSVDNVSASGDLITLNNSNDRFLYDLSFRATFSVEGEAWAVLGGSYVEASAGFVEKPTTPSQYRNGVERILTTGWAVAPVVFYNEFKEGEVNYPIFDHIDGNCIDCDSTSVFQFFARTHSQSAFICASESRANIKDFSPVRFCQPKR